MEEKVLFITSIYGKLWGTEFGGRPSRERHYKESLLNILNMKPSRCVCFTSEEEYDSLSNYFYESNNISKEVLELRVFNLKDSKYFNKIHSKKNIEQMKKTDRCYEIQYNKFFWYDMIKNTNDYDRVYWIDAGLSHGGLFPSKYIIDKNPHGSYKISLFTTEFLQRMNILTKDKVLIFSKNNGGNFFWSQTVPNKYYDKYDRSRHIIGGMFGGTPEKYQEYRDMFENMLNDLLENENQLYMEELIMSCIYVNHRDFFVTQEFDDWYQRKPGDKGIKYFYNIFE